MHKNLVFLHGFLGRPNEFDLSPLKNFDAICIDLNSAPSFALKDQAQYVKNQLTRLNIKKAHFWGYSMGGRVLLEFYKNFPEMCESLTLESVSPGIKDPLEKTTRLEKDTEWARFIRSDPEEFLEKWYAQDLFESLRSHQDFPIYKSLRQKSLSSLHAQMIAEASPGANPHHFEVIENIKVPALALVGQFDEKYCQIWGKLVAENPHIAIQIIENSGHAIHLENPAGALRQFIKFLNKNF